EIGERRGPGNIARQKAPPDHAVPTLTDPARARLPYVAGRAQWAALLPIITAAVKPQRASAAARAAGPGPPLEPGAANARIELREDRVGQDREDDQEHRHPQ